MPAGMERVEIGITVYAQDDRLAINDKMLLAVLQRRFDNPGEAFGPVVPAARRERRALFFADQISPGEPPCLTRSKFGWKPLASGR